MEEPGWMEAAGSGASDAIRSPKAARVRRPEPPGGAPPPGRPYPGPAGRFQTRVSTGRGAGSSSTMTGGRVRLK